MRTHVHQVGEVIPLCPLGVNRGQGGGLAWGTKSRQLVAVVQVKMAPATAPYTRLGQAGRRVETGRTTAADSVARATAVMMVGDWLTGGWLTLLVRPAR